MQYQSEVLLFGTWQSAYCTRVHLALKLKGVTYDHVEEDLANKSELLLKHNPVHKKVPVLVHKAKPVVESLAILEYIDECWNYSPNLLPEDPYLRAKVRFWASFYDQKVMPRTYHILFSKGEEKEKAIKEFDEVLSVFEEGVGKDFSASKFPFNGEALEMLDLVVGSNGCNYQAFEESIDLGLDHSKGPSFNEGDTSSPLQPDCQNEREILPSY